MSTEFPTLPWKTLHWISSISCSKYCDFLVSVSHHHWRISPKPTWRLSPSCRQTWELAVLKNSCLAWEVSIQFSVWRHKRRDHSISVFMGNTGRSSVCRGRWNTVLREWGGLVERAARPALAWRGRKRSTPQVSLGVQQGEGERGLESSRPHTVDRTNKLPREAKLENPSGGSSFNQDPVS